MGDPKELPRIEDLPVLQIVPVEEEQSQPSLPPPSPPSSDNSVWSWTPKKKSELPN